MPDQTFTYAADGHNVQFEVPSDICGLLRVNMGGAQGGGEVGPGLSSPGGKGGGLTFSLPVDPGDVIDVFLGGQPTDGNALDTGTPGHGGSGSLGANGKTSGFAGGGATYLTDDIGGAIIATAAGGGGDGSVVDGSGYSGGPGGGVTGLNGLSPGPAFYGGQGGAPGSQVDNGVGGLNGLNAPDTGPADAGGNGSGGPGDANGGDAGTSGDGGGGGGGGGGWFAGGGAGSGGFDGAVYEDGGGGGGGSDGFSPAFGIVDAIRYQDSTAGGGFVVFEWDTPSLTTPVVNIVPPAVVGTPTVGETLTADEGTWSGTPTGYTYQWRRCDADGGSCVDIGGETASTYVLTGADEGMTIRVGVVAFTVCHTSGDPNPGDPYYSEQSSVVAASGGGDCAAPLRELHRAGVLDGPVFTDIPGVPNCLVQEAAFQIITPYPWIFGEAELLRPEAALDEDVVCVTATTEDWPGDAGAKILISSGNGPLDGLVIRATALQPDDSDCDLRPPFLTATVRNLPAGRRIVYDSAEHRVYEEEVSSGRVVGTIEHLDFGGPIRWLEIPPCGNVCICLDPTDATLDETNRVTIYQVGREL